MRRIFLLAAHPGEGPSTEPTAATLAWWWELAFMPLTGPCRRERGKVNAVWADGQPSDKVDRLAHAMTAVKKTTAGEPIVVAQLLPLDDAEAAAVLTALGEGDPEAFLMQAESLGATGFIQSPLSLKLLRTAVADGETWPRTRYDLFASAIRRLAFERNEEHKWDYRHAPDAILGAAAKACLVLLTSGARAIWRSNDEPPAGGDARAYVTAHDLGQDSNLLRDMLDTPLFRGEGEAFEPMHRTVAEYLAGDALAEAVLGTSGGTALPLLRAVALTTGTDGIPPTELRGVYAWFAAHLVTMGTRVPDYS